MSIQNCNRVINHHIQQEYCTTRPAYRQGKKLTAVKVYTVNNESQHLYIYGVPQVNLRKELKHLCSKYGDISARIAKRLIDTRSFYGGILHVCYASECETVEETRMKLAQRRRDVHNRLPK
ncbi:RNA-binding protein 48 isoform X2 [Euwallacea fornicatus]|uniref:RNA-binding protein 48 isoform X2 n=1 Tax=Euwallacea fornicatus TaxID=995702 RepID=UPI0033906945